jgi:hypothetical protein
MKLKELQKKITPGPLETSVDCHGNFDICCPVADLSECPNAKSNAAYLCHCANNFPAVVEALQFADGMIRKWQKETGKPFPDGYGINPTADGIDALMSIESALAAAEEVRGI